MGFAVDYSYTHPKSIRRHTRFSHTIYNITSVDVHPESLAGRFRDAEGNNLIGGWVARLQGCYCSSGENPPTGEYCENLPRVSGAAARRPGVWLLAVVAVAFARAGAPS